MSNDRRAMRSAARPRFVCKACKVASEGGEGQLKSTVRIAPLLAGQSAAIRRAVSRRSAASSGGANTWAASPQESIQRLSSSR